MAEGDAVSGRKSSGFEERIFHARHLLLHGLQGLPDHGRTDLFRAQVTDFLDLQKIEERIALSGGNQSGLFPTCQLTRREPQNAKQIRSTVSVHGYLLLLRSLSESASCDCKWKSGPEEPAVALQQEWCSCKNDAAQERMRTIVLRSPLELKPRKKTWSRRSDLNR